MKANKMEKQTFMENAKVMAKGQIVNSAIYAMQFFQEEMECEAIRAGINSDEDVIDMIRELRNEDNE